MPANGDNLSTNSDKVPVNGEQVSTSSELVAANQPADLSLKEASEKWGVSESTLRRRIKDRKVPAFQVPTSQGYEWRIPTGEHLPTNDDKVPANCERPVTDNEQLLISDDKVVTAQKPIMFSDERLSTDGEKVSTNDDKPPSTQPVDLQPIIDFMAGQREREDRLHRENLELAGRIGFLQAKLQEAEAKILALEAPKQQRSQQTENEQRDAVRPGFWRWLPGLSRSK